MNLTELNDLVNNGCITNVAIIEYYTQHVDELSKLSADDLLNMQGSRIVMDYNIIVDETMVEEEPTVEDITTTTAPSEPASKKKEVNTTLAPENEEENEIVVDEGEDEE